MTRAVLFALILLTISLLGAQRPVNHDQKPVEAQQEAKFSDLQHFPYIIKPNTTLYTKLVNIGFSPLDVHNIVASARTFRDLDDIQPGVRFHVYNPHSPLVQPAGIIFRFSPTQLLHVYKADKDKWQAHRIQRKVQTEVVSFSGVVRASLWTSAARANMETQLISELTRIFAWQVDFAREVREGDRWKLSVEKRFVNGRFIGWGSILAAEYQLKNRKHRAVLFERGGEKVGYFAPDGSSLKKMFLKSPIRIGRISSDFQRDRYHPILKERRAHLGVDYAAPTGTPVRCVGDGQVIYVGHRQGGGKTIVIRHNSVYKTAYKHLSGYARGIEPGTSVKQGQRIGYVGATGLATGSHLHFEFYRNGRFVDPLGIEFPSADPVAQKHMSQFKKQARKKIADLETTPLPLQWQELVASHNQPAPLFAPVKQSSKVSGQQ